MASILYINLRVGEFLWNYDQKLRRYATVLGWGCVQLVTATTNHSNWWQAAPFVIWSVKIARHRDSTSIYFYEVNFEEKHYCNGWGGLGFGKCNNPPLKCPTRRPPLVISSLKTWLHRDDISIHVWVNFRGMLINNWGDIIIDVHWQGINWLTFWRNAKKGEIVSHFFSNRQHNVRFASVRA